MKGLYGGVKRNCKQLIFILVFILSMTSLCFGFSDLSDTNPAFNDVKLLTEAGFLKGYPDGTFRPDGTITRAEFVRMTNQVFGYKDQVASNLFSDVNTKEWYYQDVMIALQEGYTIGYPDGTFRPNGNITREEVCAITDRILQLSNQVPITSMETITISDRVSSWAKDSVSRVIAKGLMPLGEKGNFRSVEKATRVEVSSILANVLRQKTEIEQRENQKKSTWQDLGIDPEVGAAIDNTLLIMRNEIITANILTNNQKAMVRNMVDALDAYLITGDESALIQSGKNIKRSYESMSSADQASIEKEIRRCIPVTDLYLIKDYFF